ncbi:MAG: histidine phosphatase family protein [Chloroflexi bacterium]|nr:histidine phosphatase family protein [Chloroflexota bacterium]
MRSPATMFLLVRHGQTDWNRVLRFRGRANLDLDETGLRQARAASLYLERFKPVVAYTSPLQRAWRTAWTIAQGMGLQVYPLLELMDIDYGEWQGLSPDEARTRYHSLYDQWQNQPQSVQFPGGESLAEVQRRAAAGLTALAPRHAGQAVVLVSHEVVCKCLLCWALGLDLSGFWRVKQDVAAINIIEVSNGVPVLVLANETCHLKDLA